MRLIHLLIQNTFRNTLRFSSFQTQNVLILRAVTSTEDDSIKLTFSNSPSLSIKALKHQDVSTVLSTIKLKYALLQKKREIRRSMANKYFNTAPVEVETTEEYEDVQLLSDDKLINESTPNIDAWSQASILKIGDMSYEVQFNSPAVKNMSLPDYIVCGCYLRPHFILECASFHDCIFTWYRSINNDIVSESSSVTDWIKVGEDFNYFVTSKDIGCYLKVVCSPRNDSRIGMDFTAVSRNTVEAGPEIFPFEERQVHTKSECSNNQFRCVSYNTLANIYVDKHKFPYASEKARDIYYRKQLLTREILGYNSDVICLQEVQERVFDYDYYPVFKKAGFDGFFTRKGGRVYEGLATFFKTSKFKIIYNKSLLLNEIIKEKGIFGDLLNKVSGNFKDMSKMLAQDTALQILFLENLKKPVNKILVANTHLYSNKDMPEVRLLQAALCVYYIEHLFNTQLTDCDGILFCGDFNSLPDSEAYEFVTSGNFHCCPTWKNSNTNVTEDTTLRHNLCLKSACGIPTYTNYTADFHGCLDYIFYSKNSLEVTDIVPMPSHDKVIAQVGLPSDYFPSDHIALVCTLKWKK